MSRDQSAPGSLELVRLFVNSLDLDHPEHDPFLTGGTAAQWLGARGFAANAPSAVELEALRDLREALRADLVSHGGAGSGGRTWPAVATLLAGTGLEVVFAPSGGVQLVPRGDSATATLRGSLAAAIYDAVRDGSWRRLKACRKHSCLFAFYDRSKNGSGAWCNMAVCGNRVKAERRRARERSKAPD
jgi:predicted RNA-binding Zn ribbon-like protein